MKNFILIIFLFASVLVFAQQPDPVHFNYSIIKTGDKTYAVHITANLERGWHIYAQVQPKSAISIPTKINFTKNPLISLVGKIKEAGKIKKQTIAAAGIEQLMYEHNVDFVQDITLKSNVKTNITGTITYQACTEEQCLKEKTIPFSITIQ